MRHFPGAHSTVSRGLLASLILLLSSGCSVLGIRTVEEAPHRVIQQDGRFELRHYSELVVVQTSVSAGYDEAGEIAFDRLFGYISGENIERSKIAMTAPVMIEPRVESEGVKIAMTAPVLAQGSENDWQIAFVLPSSFTQETAPLPSNPLVELATIPPRLVAAVRFSGTLGEKSVREQEKELAAWIEGSALVHTSAPRSAGYDPPWTPPFLRRNEVLIDVEREG